MIKLETKRLILRDFERKDFKELAKQGNSKDINFFNWYIPFPFTEEDSKKRISDLIKNNKSKSRTLYELAIILKETRKLVGVRG